MMELVAILLIPAATLSEECRPISPRESIVQFEIEQAGSVFKGRFKDVAGEICIAGDAVNRIDVSVATDSVETGLPELDAALKGDEFFHSKAFPVARFRSTHVSGHDDNRVAYGALQIKEHRKDIELPFTLTSADGLAASGRLEIRRLEYSIGTGEWADTEWLADTVVIHFDIHLSP